MTTVLRSLFATVLISPFSYALADCSRGDIDHYLERGFTPQQITQICGKVNSPAAVTTKEPAATAAPVVATEKKPVEKPVKIPQPVSVNTATNNDEYFLRTVLDAENFNITDDAIIITQDRCFSFGAEDSIGIQKEICGKMETRITRQNLTIVRVTNPIPVLRDAELIVEGKIIRNTQFSQPPKKYDQKAFGLDYPKQPTQINIAVKKGHKPSDIAPILERLTTN